MGNNVTWHQVLVHGVPFIENFSNTFNHKENQKDEHVMTKQVDLETKLECHELKPTSNQFHQYNFKIIFVQFIDYKFKIIIGEPLISPKKF